MNNDIVMGLYNRPETVFSLDEISQIFPHISYESLRDRLYYFAKIGKLKRIRNGLYTKEKYDPFELVNKLYKPSYISLETVLSREGVTFQYYETIFAMSYLSREITLENINIRYRQIKREVLLNPAGLEEKTSYFIAGKERAFLDAVYLYKDYHFDNLEGLDWKKIENLKKIYKNKAFEKRVKSYYHDYLEEENVNKLNDDIAKVIKEENVAAKKISVILSRKKFAGRDLFDLWFYLKNGFGLNEEIVLKNTGLSVKQALNKALEQVEKVKQKELLQGLGELLDNSQKIWVKEKLKDELLFQIRLYLKIGKL